MDNPAIWLLIVAGLLVSGLVGASICRLQGTGRERQGFVLGFLGPVGWIIAALLRPLKNEDGEKDEAYRRYLYTRAHQNAAAAGVRGSQELDIARNGEILGRWTVTEIRSFVSGNRLLLEDDYYDIDTGEWLPLAAHPAFGAGSSVQ